MPSKHRNDADRESTIKVESDSGFKFIEVVTRDKLDRAFSKGDLGRKTARSESRGASDIIEYLDEHTARFVEFKRGWMLVVSSADTESDDARQQEIVAHDNYSLAVGARVMELVGELVDAHPDIVSTPPETLAEALVDVAIDAEADRSELADLLAPFWSAKRTQEALGGLTRSSMLERRRTGALLGLKTTDGDIFYPVAQFEAHDGGVRVKPDLRLFMMALRERDPWTVAVLLHTPADELGRFTPLDWVRRDRDVKPLLDYAKRLNAEYSR